MDVLEIFKKIRKIIPYSVHVNIRSNVNGKHSVVIEIIEPNTMFSFLYFISIRKYKNLPEKNNFIAIICDEFIRKYQHRGSGSTNKLK
jgi:hypothetical protein